MADTTDEEHLDKLTNPKSESYSAEITHPKNTGIIEPKQETENMEVHHHPHIEKKNFKEYFLEFIMIFLAVTMGFFAERYREHIVEKNSIHDYMQEMVANLQYDSVRCVLNYKTNINLEKGMDSLRAEIKQGIHGNINSNALYYYSLQYFGSFGHAAFNNSAVTELKNSGSMRLIESKDLAAEMYDYYQRKIFAADSYKPSDAEIDENKKLSHEFFSLTDVDNYVESYDGITAKNYDNNYNYQKVLEHHPPLQLLKKDSANLERLYTGVADHEIKIKYYNFWLLYCEKASEKLAADIKTEYHLENE